MVVVELKQRNPKNESEWITKSIYLDGYLKSNLDAGLALLHKDFDQVWFVDGAEGGGKTELATTCAYYVTNEDTRHKLIERLCPSAEIFERAILKAKQFEAVVLDEGYAGMSSAGSISKINRILQRRFTEIRAKNLFVFILAPSFMDIMRYFAIWRSKCLLHIYLGPEHERGRAMFYNEQRKKKLYIMGKKQFYNYNVVPSNFTFRFTKQMYKLIDKDEYDKQKEIHSLSEREEQSSNATVRRELIKGILSRMNELDETKGLGYEKKLQVLGIPKTTYYSYLSEVNQEKEIPGEYPPL